MAASGEFPKLPLSVSFFHFFFLRKSSCSILLLYTQRRACPVTQPTSPARLGTVQVRAPHCPTLNSPQPAHTVSVGLPLGPYSPPCDFKQPYLSLCCSNLVWQGRELLTQLSPKSPVADQAGSGLGATVTLVLVLVPGILLSLSNPLTMWFFSVFYIFWSPIFIYAGVLLAVRVVPQ